MFHHAGHIMIKILLSNISFILTALFFLLGTVHLRSDIVKIGPNLGGLEEGSYENCAIYSTDTFEPEVNAAIAVPMVSTTNPDWGGSWNLSWETDYYFSGIDEKVPGDSGLYGAGFNIVRIPFRWEYLQAHLNTDLHPSETPINPYYLGYLKSVVIAAAGKNVEVILDMHNYGSYVNATKEEDYSCTYATWRYIGDVPDGEDVPSAGNIPDDYYVYIWKYLATHFAGYDNVSLGLMNEPNYRYDETHNPMMQDVDASVLNAKTLVTSYNKVIEAVRGDDVGFTGNIYLGSNGYSTAANWAYSTPVDVFGGYSNADTFGDIVDPGTSGEIYVDVHQYLNTDNADSYGLYSGACSDCAQTGCTTLVDNSKIAGLFTSLAQWFGAGDTGDIAGAFLGEFAAGTDSTNLAAIDAILAYVSSANYFIGATGWGGGPEFWTSGVYDSSGSLCDPAQRYYSALDPIGTVGVLPPDIGTSGNLPASSSSLIIADTPQIIQIKASVAEAQQLQGNLPPLTGLQTVALNWRYSDSLGYLYVKHALWVYSHTFNSWIYLSGKSESNFWIYVLGAHDGGKWLWTSTSLFPIVYILDKKEWAYYVGTKNGRERQVIILSTPGGYSDL